MLDYLSIYVNSAKLFTLSSKKSLLDRKIFDWHDLLHPVIFIYKRKFFKDLSQKRTVLYLSNLTASLELLKIKIKQKKPSQPNFI